MQLSRTKQVIGSALLGGVIGLITGGILVLPIYLRDPPKISPGRPEWNVSLVFIGLVVFFGLFAGIVVGILKRGRAASALIGAIVTSFMFLLIGGTFIAAMYEPNLGPLLLAGLFVLVIPIAIMGALTGLAAGIFLKRTSPPSESPEFHLPPLPPEF